MARIRSIKPEFWTSEQVMECSLNARLLFIGMWNFADDCGRLPLAPKTIKAQIFPGDDISSEIILGMVGELSNNGLLLHYVVAGKEFLQITGWQHQRIDKPQPAKYPAPINGYSSTIPRTLATDRKGEEGKGEDRIDGDVVKSAGASMISPEAFEVADALEKACGFNLPEEIPPGWCGGAMWVQKCLNQGWIGAVMIEATKGVALRKKGGFIESFKYLEKPLAQAMAEHRAPLPQVEIRQPDKLTVIANGKSESLANVAARLAESGVTFGERPRGIRVEEGGDNVRLLSKG